MTRFVLIAGGWHGGWCWERVAPLLLDRGHEVVAPDLPGVGGRSPASGAVSLDDWANFVAEIVGCDPMPTILVGHSRAGIVISRTAELIPDRLAGLVYVSAVMAPPGVSMAEAVGFAGSEDDLFQYLALSDDGRSTRWSSSEAAIRIMYGATDLRTAKQAVARLGYEPLDNVEVPLDLSAERYGVVPRAYVECLRDATLPIEVQRAMVSRQPCVRHSIDSDHSPFYSAPERLAEVLLDIDAGWRADSL